MAPKPVCEISRPCNPYFRRSPWAIPGTIAGLVLALIVLVWWWRKRTQPEFTLPAAPPHEIAFAALDDLRKANTDSPAALRTFYFKLSEIVRSYVENRFGINATDLTTEEIISHLGNIQNLDHASQGLLNPLFASRRPG